MTAAAAITALAAAAIGTASASTATAPRWRFAYTSHTVMSAFSGVAAVSPHDAWAVGAYAPQGGAVGARPIVERWNGKSWSAVTLPKRFRTNAELTAVAASSPTNVWVFGFSRDSKGLNPQTFALRWNGSWSTRGDWHTYNFVSSATVLNAHNVWIFGTDWTRHFNGTGWTTWKLSFSVIQASGINANDIWAVGASTSNLAPVLARFHNGKWRLLPAPVSSTATSQSQLLGVLAHSDADVWVAGGTAINGTNHALALQRVNGTWIKHNPPGSESLGALVSDGTGGMWATFANGPYDAARVDHYSGGRWRAIALPTVTGKATSVTTLAHAPRSITVFGAGIVLWGGMPETEGTILKYSS
jgi:hypothetical protein